MKEVGQVYDGDRLPFSYAKVPKDEEGFADASLYHPLPFDVVDMDVVKKDGKRVFCGGWWTGNKWFSLRLRKGDKVLKWKKREESYE
ncbi:hypothetical protein HC928_02725 [bacterium]|nr:hypothetical protein [bacterium]